MLCSFFAFLNKVPNLVPNKNCTCFLSNTCAIIDTERIEHMSDLMMINNRSGGKHHESSKRNYSFSNYSSIVFEIQTQNAQQFTNLFVGWHFGSGATFLNRWRDTTV